MTGLPPAVPVFPAGYAPLPADFNSWVQAPFQALTSRVVFRAAKTTAQTLAAGTNTAIAFNSIIEDPYSGWNSGTNTWTPPAAWSGTYVVSAGIFVAGTTGVRLAVSVGLNGSSLYTLCSAWANTSPSNAVCGEAPVQLVGGQDQISVLGFASAAVAVGTAAGQQCTVEITWYSN